MAHGFHEHRAIILGGGAFLLGVWVAANGVTLTSMGLAVFLAFGFWKLKIGVDFVLVLLMVFCFGILRYGWAVPTLNDGNLEYHHDEEQGVSVEGVIVDYPDVRGDRIKLTIESESLNGQEVKGKVLATVHRYPEYSYGQRVKFWGLLQEPAEFDTFSYKNYLRRYGIGSVMYHPSMEVTEERAQVDWRWFIFKMKEAIEDRLNRLYTEPHASFAAGLLLGARRGIPPELMEDFNISGLTHIIAISGYNITLIIVFVSGILQFLSKRWQTVIASVVIVVFVVLVGGTAAVVRAAIMGVLGLWAIWFGRKAEVTRLLALTAVFMTAWNPFILVDDVGFQLSFAATCGLVYMTPSVERVLEWARIYHRIPKFFSIREAFVTTLAAQTLAVPIIIASFGRFSLVAPFANVAAVSFIPLAMLCSFVAMLASYLWWDLGLVIAYVGWFFLELIMQIAHWSARVPFSSIEFGVF